MDVVGARGGGESPARGEGWEWERWEAPGRLGRGFRGPRGDVPQEDSSPASPPGSALRSSLASFWPRFLLSSGGPRHHDPEEQVEKIRWQHYIHQLHSQTGRRPGHREPGPRAVPCPEHESGARRSGFRARSSSLCSPLPSPGVQPPQRLLPASSLLSCYPCFLVFASRRLSVALGS